MYAGTQINWYDDSAVNPATQTTDPNPIVRYFCIECIFVVGTIIGDNIIHFLFSSHIKKVRSRSYALKNA